MAAIAGGGALVGLGAAALTGGALLGTYDYVHDRQVCF